MGTYILKRFLISLVTIFVMLTATFFMMKFMPGDPFNNEKTPAAVKELMKEKYGFDKPLPEQYVSYLKQLSHLDLGLSLSQPGRSVGKDIIAREFPATAKIGSLAILYSLLIGIILGIIAAMFQNKWPDRVCLLIATLGITIPSFVVGALLIYTFSVHLKLLPPTGFKSWKNMIMPVIALSGTSISFIARLIRSKMVDVLNSDYIRTARAKGLTEYTVVTKHALKNSIIPVVSYVGPLIANLLTGSFVIEQMFAIPGLGREFVTSISNRDYSIILGVTIFYCTILIICTFLVDIVYSVIDPRIKLTDASN